MALVVEVGYKAPMIGQGIKRPSSAVQYWQSSLLEKGGRQKTRHTTTTKLVDKVI